MEYLKGFFEPNPELTGQAAELLHMGFLILDDETDRQSLSDGLDRLSIRLRKNRPAAKLVRTARLIDHLTHKLMDALTATVYDKTEPPPLLLPKLFIRQHIQSISDRAIYEQIFQTPVFGRVLETLYGQSPPEALFTMPRRTVDDYGEARGQSEAVYFMSDIVDGDTCGQVTAGFECLAKHIQGDELHSREALFYLTECLTQNVLLELYDCVLEKRQPTDLLTLKRALCLTLDAVDCPEREAGIWQSPYLPLELMRLLRIKPE